MSGGPQVFLGATTFCCRCRQFSGCRQISDRREACPPARRPRRELRSARRLEARPGPAGLAAASNRAALGMIPPGPAAAHVQRSQAPQASRRPPIGRPSCSAMSHVIRLRVFQTVKSHRWNCNVLRGTRKLTPGNYVRLLFWLTSWPRRTDNETPLNNDAVRGLVLTVIRRPSASLLRRLCTRRSPPR